MGKMTGVLVLVVSVGLAQAAIVDDFNRSDSTTIGNGWTESSVSAYGGDLSDARITSGKVGFYRDYGGEPWSRVSISRAVDLSPTVRADLHEPAVSGWNQISMWAGNSTTGKFLYVRFMAGSSDVSIDLYNSVDGTWNIVSGWNYGPSGVANPGELQVQFTVDALGNTAMEARKKSDQTIFWSWTGTNSGLSGGMDNVAFESYWNNWWDSTHNPTVDNVLAIPEPATLTLMGLALLGIYKPRK